MSITVTIELTAEQAAALTRLCDKLTYEDAQRFLYPHLPKDIRDEQVHHMLGATVIAHKALLEAGARAWPWIDTGVAAETAE